MTESVAPGTIEIDYYYERVAAALADLPAETREELLDDLPAHFAEVIAEQGGPLIERLGPPATYAAELRAAAGLDADPAPAAKDRAPIVIYYERLRAALPDLDRRAGQVIGYPRATEFLRLLRPAWWIARAVCIVVLVFAADIVPTDRFDDPLGWLLLAVAIVVSVRIGATGRPRMPRWVGFTVTAVAVVGALFLVTNTDGLLYRFSGDYSPQSSYFPPAWQGVSDVYPVDEHGRPLDNVTLYDQDGNPIRVGDYWRCQPTDSPIEPPPPTYPLCKGPRLGSPAPTTTPSDSGPASASPAVAGTPSTSASTSVSAAPSASPVPSPSR